MDRDLAKATLEKHGLLTSEGDGIKKVAGYLQNFFLKPHKEGVLRAYVEREVVAGQLFLVNAMGGNPIKQLTREQLDVLAERIADMCRVLLA